MKNLLLLSSFIFLFLSCKEEEIKSSGPPIISAINPTSGNPDTEITITGSDFSTTLSDNIVNFNGIKAIVVSSTSSSLIAKVPIGAGNGAITITTSHGTGTSSVFTYLPDIFIAGTESDGTTVFAKYWKNGIAFPITNGTKNISIYSMAVAGNDVYLSGSESNGTVNISKYWKNGVAVPLTDGTHNASASTIVVTGNDIYVVGSETNGKNWIAKYWKNGIAVPLTNGITSAGASDIAIVGNDVYVAGDEDQSNGVSIAKIWKNGTPISLAHGTDFSAAYYFAVSGNDIYATGTENFKFRYWKNGVITSIPNTDNLLVDDIITVANDVHMVGRQSGTALYIKNEVVSKLTDGTMSAYAHGITHYGEDVYITGNEYNGKVMIGKYWKNGVAFPLTDGTLNASFWAIVVR